MVKPSHSLALVRHERFAHRAHARALARHAGEILREAPRQLPEALLVALLREDGAAGRIPKLPEQHLRLQMDTSCFRMKATVET